MKRFAVMTVILMTMLAGCVASDESTGADGAAEEAAAEVADRDAADRAAAGGAGEQEAADRGTGGGGEEQAVGDAAPDGVDDRASAVLTAGIGDRIVRDGTMRIRVEETPSTAPSIVSSSWPTSSEAPCSPATRPPLTTARRRAP
ncbi:MAG TPA: hypothetical protein VK923_00695 [Euzebyales bacterium]|nr:hypothetical protein [Euzebyales bacterium]